MFHKRKGVILLISTLAIFIIAGESKADIYNSIEDSYVDESNSVQNNGSGTRLRVRGSGSGRGQISYLKFVVSGFTPQVVDVKLKLYANSGTGDNVTAYQVLDNSWTEGAITWGNRPALGAALGSKSVTDNDWTKWDVTNFITGDGTYTIALQCDVDVQQSFRSREHSSMPELETSEDFTTVIDVNWAVGSSPYETDDVIVYAVSAADYNIVNDGSVDVANDIQTLIDGVWTDGGGVVFLEEGVYRLDSGIQLREGVFLRGIWEEPTPGQSINGTVLAIYDRRGSTSKIPSVELERCTGVKDMVFWYPEQDPAAIVPYPPTTGVWRRISGDSMRKCVTMERLTFVNSYIAMGNDAEDPGSSPAAHYIIKNVHGTALYKVVDFGKCTGNPKFTGMFFEPDYWKYSGFAGSPTGTEHEAFMLANGIGIDFHTSGQTYAQFGKFVGLKYGIYHTSGDTSIYEMDFSGCDRAMQIQSGNMRAVHCYFSGSTYGLLINDSASEQVYHSCTFDGGTSAIQISSAKSLGLQACTLENKINNTSGVLSVVDCDFTFAGRHVTLSGGTKGAAILGNRFGGNPFDYANTSGSMECLKIDHSPLYFTPIPSFTWADFTNYAIDFKPGNAVLYNVMDYGAVADSSTDDTAAIQAALDAAGAAGGGIVMVPPGWYNVPGTLNIPSEVELRGSAEGCHAAFGDEHASVLFVSNGQGDANGTPFITMQAYSGLKGLSFFYPDQIMPPYKYPFLVRGAGENIYMFNNSATNPSHMVDIATNRCDRAYIETFFTNTLDLTYKIGGGTTGARIINGQGKGYWTTAPSSIKTFVPDNSAVNAYTSDNMIQIDAGDVTDFFMLGNFTRENHYFFLANEENGQAPDNVVTINNGGEGSVRCYQINALESDLAIVNSQFKINRASAENPLKYQFGLNYTGPAKVVAYGTVMDSKTEMEGYIYDGHLELQAMRFDQQITYSGFFVDSPGRFVMSTAYSPEECPFAGDGTIDLIGCYLEDGVSVSNSDNFANIFERNIVLTHGRAVQANTYEVPVYAGMEILNTADSNNEPTTRQEVWGGTGKTLHFTGRRPTLVPGQTKRFMYFDVTSSDFIGQNHDCDFELNFFIEPNSTGSIEIYYDKNTGTTLAGTIDTSLGSNQGKWKPVSYTMNNCRFQNNINGGDIRIDVPDTAEMTILWAAVLEKATHCDDLGPANYHPDFTSDPIFEISAREDLSYNSSIADNASDPEGDAMTFTKIEGPAWLNVAANGLLTGTPDNNDVGYNQFTVAVQDSGPDSDEAVLHIKVTGNPDINSDGDFNFEDFEIMESNWFSPCSAPQWCEGADLNISGLVDFQDVNDLAQSWLSTP